MEGCAGKCEIEEEEEEESVELGRQVVAAGGGGECVRPSGPAVCGGDEDDVYVAVGKGNSSMDALSWALKNVATPSSFVYLIHVFPEVHHIPTPLGMLPKNKVNSQQVETHMSQERGKRREMLQKYLNLCHNYKVDTILVESDLIAKAILELIPVLHIKRLIMGTSKSNLRMVKRGSGKAGQVQREAPEYCEVKIICDGQEVLGITDQTVLASPLPSPTPPNPTELASPLPSPSPPNPTVDSKGKETLDDEHNDRVSCNCFSRKTL